MAKDSNMKFIFRRVRGRLIPIKVGGNNFDKWHGESKKIESEVNRASDNLKKISGNHGGKITPDHIRATLEFKTAKNEYERAFQLQRTHNETAPKEFLKKASELRRAARFKRGF